jgi:peroxiredoxin
MPIKLHVGDPVPWFAVRCSSNEEYHFGTTAGRHIVLVFLGSAAVPQAGPIYQSLRARRELFDDIRASLFIVSNDAADEHAGRFREELPGIRVFWDFDAAVADRFGVISGQDSARSISLCAAVLDPTLRLMRWFFSTPDRINFADELLDFIAQLPSPLRGVAQSQAPIIILPRVFEPELCRELIEYYETKGGEDSGYMKSEKGMIHSVVDYSVKRRSDCHLKEDHPLRQAAAARIKRRMVPEILRVFRFQVTRVERYMVCCYDSAVGGYFRPHRDNDGDGHRQFAVTLNLNAEEYEGGDLRFPEYGRQTYRAPTGGACIFSCGLMHEATPVTRGKRYAFVPFLYDEASARQREVNNARYADPSLHYKMDRGSAADT